MLRLDYPSGHQVFCSAERAFSIAPSSELVDELETVCANRPPRVLLSPSVCDDPDVASRLQHAATELMEFSTLEEFAEPYQDLLERQLRLILKRFTNPSRN